MDGFTMTAFSIQHSHTSFENELIKFTATRKQVSDRLYHFLHVLVAIMALCSVAFAAAYAFQLGETWFYKIVIVGAAAGIECSLIFFAAAMYPKIVLKVFGCLAGVGVVVISIFTAMSFLLSQQYVAEHQTTELQKAYAGKLQSNLNSLDVVETQDRGTVGRLSDRLEKQLDDLKEEKGSKATAVYHYAAHTLGYSVESVSFIMRFIWALVFVSVAIALASFLETIYSPHSLSKWINELKKERAVLRQAKDELDDIGIYTSPAIHRESAVEPAEMALTEPQARHRRTQGVGDEISDSSYQKIKKAVQEGAVKPSVAQLKKLARGTEKAYQAIDRMLVEEVIQQKKNGRYAIS